MHRETWWWNEEVDRAVAEKRDWYRIWSNSKTEANKMVYNQMRKYAWKVVYSAKESHGSKFRVRLENEACKGNLFKAAYCHTQEKDVVENSSMKNIRGDVVTAPTISLPLHSCIGLATYWRMCKCCVTYLLTNS